MSSIKKKNLAVGLPHTARVKCLFRIEDRGIRYNAYITPRCSRLPPCCATSPLFSSVLPVVVTWCIMQKQHSCILCEDSEGPPTTRASERRVERWNLLEQGLRYTVYYSLCLYPSTPGLNKHLTLAVRGDPLQVCFVTIPQLTFTVYAVLHCFLFSIVSLPVLHIMGKNILII